MVGHTTHQIKISADFIKKLQTTTVNDMDNLISLDLIPLFTKVSVKGNLKLLDHKFQVGILHLFTKIHKKTHVFFFNDKFYDHKGDVAMESPLAQIVANYFVKDSELPALNTAKKSYHLLISAKDDLGLKV
jgi:hypothetical protein